MSLNSLRLPPSSFTEYWLKSTDDEDPTEYYQRLEKERKKFNVRPKGTFSRASLMLQFAQLKDYSAWMENWRIELSEEEAQEAHMLIQEAQKKLQFFAMRAIPKKATEIALAVAAGMRNIQQGDYQTIAAWSVYWLLFRSSNLCSDGSSSSLTAWATSFQRIAFEATNTGATNQKNKITLFSMGCVDRFWKGTMGSSELLHLHMSAFMNGFDTRAVIWEISSMMEDAYQKLQTKSLEECDYLTPASVLEDFKK